MAKGHNGKYNRQKRTKDLAKITACWNNANVLHMVLNKGKIMELPALKHFLEKG